MSVTKSEYGKTPQGETVYLYTLANGTVTAEILTYGGILRSLRVPDKNGAEVDVVLGRDSMSDYLNNSGYLGALIGRHANRIENAEFTLNGQTYRVGKNEGENSLHGGNIGFDKKVWNACEHDGEEPSLTLTLTSPDGEEGFPGNLDVTVTYTVTKDNALKIHYEAVSDKDTVVNLTNHAYFNLAGHGSGEMTEQLLKLNASFFTPNNDGCMPTGEVLSVEGTPFDFRAEKKIGKDINSDFEQIKMFSGYDHNFVIDGAGCRLAATARCEENGVTMDVYTDKPGVQLYTSNGLKEGVYKCGARCGVHHAFCLETQYFPNSAKYAHFPSPVLKAGDKYDFTTEYRFSVK